MIAYRETAGLAKQLVEHSCKPQGIVPGQLKLYVRLATEIGLFRNFDAGPRAKTIQVQNVLDLGGDGNSPEPFAIPSPKLEKRASPVLCLRRSKTGTTVSSNCGSQI